MRGPLIALPAVRYLLLNLLLQRVYRQFLDQDCKLVFLLLHFLPRCDQLDGLCPLAPVVFLLFALPLLKLINGLFEPFIVLDA